MQNIHTGATKESLEAQDTCSDLHEQGLLRQCLVDEQPPQPHTLNSRRKAGEKKLFYGVKKWYDSRRLKCAKGEGHLIKSILA